METALRPMVLLEECGKRRLWGSALSSHLRERRVSQRMADRCRERLRARGLSADIRVEEDDTATQPGAALALFAQGATTILGADRAGAPRRTAESIGDFVAQALLEDMDAGATVDRHLADQLIVFAGLADGVSRFLAPRVTEHMHTNLWLVETLLGARGHINDGHVWVQGVGFGRGRKPGSSARK